MRPKGISHRRIDDVFAHRPFGFPLQGVRVQTLNGKAHPSLNRIVASRTAACQDQTDLNINRRRQHVAA